MVVTGAGGYVGGGFVETLQVDGWDVHALVRRRAPHLSVEQTIADIDEDPEAVAGACKGADTVVHLAGENEVAAAREPAAALGSTVLATERVVEEAKAAGVKRLVYMSTVHVYGERMIDGATLTEDMRPEPRATYAISRLASEHVAASLGAGGPRRGRAPAHQLGGRAGGPGGRPLEPRRQRPLPPGGDDAAGSSCAPRASSGATSSPCATCTR